MESQPIRDPELCGLNKSNRTIHPGFNDCYVESALGLPIGTIKNSRGNDPALDALVRIIQLYPWVLEVASHGFDTKFAARKMIHAAADLI